VNENLKKAMDENARLLRENSIRSIKPRDEVLSVVSHDLQDSTGDNFNSDPIVRRSASWTQKN
jgi:hypothetical protein